MAHDDVGTGAEPSGQTPVAPPAPPQYTPPTPLAGQMPKAPPYTLHALPRAPARQGDYPPASYDALAPQPRTPVVAIVGLVLAFVAPIIGVVVSIMALRRARRGEGGRTQAIAGIAVGTVAVVVPLVLLLLIANQTDDKREARSAFERLDDAIARADCDGYMANSTETYRKELGVVTCAAFAAFTEPVGGSESYYGSIPITDVVVDGETATVSTLMTVDPDAAPVVLEYTLVRQDGVWLVDAFEFRDWD